MNTKHTPGPWKTVQAKSAISIKAHDGLVTIANIGWMLRANYPDTCEANARLIAAAPDLLAACELATHDLQRMMALLEVHAKMSFKGGSFESNLAELKEAIAKATA